MEKRGIYWYIHNSRPDGLGDMIKIQYLNIQMKKLASVLPNTSWISLMPPETLCCSSCNQHNMYMVKCRYIPFQSLPMPQMLPPKHLQFKIPIILSQNTQHWSDG